MAAAPGFRHVVAPKSALIGLVLLSTALAHVLYFRVVAAAGVSNLPLVTFPIPPMPIQSGTSFPGERLAFRHFAGMTLIDVGLAPIDGRLTRLLRPAK